MCKKKGNFDILDLLENPHKIEFEKQLERVRAFEWLQFFIYLGGSHVQNYRKDTVIYYDKRKKHSHLKHAKFSIWSFVFYLLNPSTIIKRLYDRKLLGVGKGNESEKSLLCYEIKEWSNKGDLIFPYSIDFLEDLFRYVGDKVRETLEIIEKPIKELKDSREVYRKSDEEVKDFQNKLEEYNHTVEALKKHKEDKSKKIKTQDRASKKKKDDEKLNDLNGKFLKAEKELREVGGFVVIQIIDSIKTARTKINRLEELEPQAAERIAISIVKKVINDIEEEINCLTETSNNGSTQKKKNNAAGENKFYATYFSIFIASIRGGIEKICEDNLFLESKKYTYLNAFRSCPLVTQVIGECDLKIIAAKNEDEKDKKIKDFETNPKENEHTVLIVEVSKELSKSWTLKMCNHEPKDFDKNSCSELATELEKEREKHDTDKIIRLAKEYLDVKITNSANEEVKNNLNHIHKDFSEEDLHKLDLKGYFAKIKEFCDDRSLSHVELESQLNEIKKHAKDEGNFLIFRETAVILKDLVPGEYDSTEIDKDIIEKIEKLQEINIDIQELSNANIHNDLLKKLKKVEMMAGECGFDFIRVEISKIIAQAINKDKDKEDKEEKEEFQKMKNNVSILIENKS